MCLICEKTFTNEGMKPSRMINHLKAKHHEKINKDVAYFRDLKVRFEKRSTIGTLFKSYEINLRKDLLHLTKFQNSLLNVENHIQLVKLLLYQQRKKSSVLPYSPLKKINNFDSIEQ